MVVIKIHLGGTPVNEVLEWFSPCATLSVLIVAPRVDLSCVHKGKGVCAPTRYLVHLNEISFRISLLNETLYKDWGVFLLYVRVFDT